MSRNKFGQMDDTDDEGSEANWQDSYSDLMTDLLAIFVVLFSFAMMNQAIVAYQKVAVKNQESEAIYTTTDGVLGGEDSILENQLSILPEPTQATENTEPSEAEELVDSIDDYIMDAKLSELLSVSEEAERKVVLHVASSLLFESGSAEVTKDAGPVLEKLASIFMKFEKSITLIKVEGHTDDVPIHNERFDSNWELSSIRAVNVVKQLVELSEFPSKLFSATGYSEFHPIAENDTEEGREKNRRVSFVIETMN